MTVNNKRTIRIAILVAIPLLALIIFLNGPSIVTVESEPGAQIALAHERSGEFTTIGAGKVTHLIFGTPATKYISATLDGKQTITTVQTKRWSPQSIKIAIADMVEARKVSDGAVVDPIFNGNKGQGIVASQNILVNFNTESADEPVNPEFVSLPYIQKVIWYDYDNFVYLSDEGVGQFINGANQGFQNVGTTTSGDVRIEAGATAANGSPYIRDIAKDGDNPLVLLSNTNVFTSSNMGSKLRAVYSFDPPNSDMNIFASGGSIFKVTAPELGHTHANEAEEEVHEDEEPYMAIEEISYTGKIINASIIDDDQAVVDIVKKGSTTYVLTLTGVHTINGEDVQKEGLYFTDIAGMTLYQGEVVILADDGLWSLSEDGRSYQLLYRFADNGVALTGSLSVDPSNQLYFGTRAREGSSEDGATFVTSF